MHRVSLLLMLLITFNTVNAEQPEHQRWIDRKSEGWFWYKSEPEPDDYEASEPSPGVPSSNQSKEETPNNPPLSSAWIRENIQFYLDAANDNPTPENVAAFLYIQRYAMDKSFAFMDAVQEATIGNPDLDEINRRPTATFANRKLDESATINHKKILDKISSNTGIFLFLDDSPSSISQNEIFDMLSRNHHFDVIKVSISDITPNLQNIAGIRPDKGHAEQMGIRSAPAVVLLRGDGLFDVISHALVSYPDLQKRILIGAKRLQIISDSDFDSTRPIVISINTLVSLPEPNSSVDSTVPIPPQDIINAFTGQR